MNTAPLKAKLTHRWKTHPVSNGIRFLSYHEDDKPVRWFLEVNGCDEPQPGTIEIDLNVAALLVAALAKVKP